MADETGKVLHGPWSTYTDPPMLFEDFRNLVQQHLNDFSIARNSLSYVSRLFREGREIWPDQCERVLVLIRSINEPVQNTCQLLDSPSQLPEAVIPFRYPLAVTLCHLDDRIGNLMQRITLFRTICRQSTVEVIKQREEIHRQFEPLMESYDDAVHELDILLDRVYFHKSKRESYG
jgi:hypothetical protein